MQERVACLSLRNPHLSNIHHISVYGPRKGRIRHSASSIYYAMNLSFAQSLSHVWLFVIPWTIACQASLSFTISQSLLQLLSIESVMPSSLLVLSRPSLFAFNSSSIRVFSNESAVCIRWPEYWSVSISPSSDYSGLISFRIDRFDFLVVQGTLKSFSSTMVWKHQLFHTQASYGPTLTSIHDYWKNHGFDYMHLYRQSNVSAF